jgi:hypothetical protein
MSRIGVVAVATLFALFVGTAHADTSTAPGQEKKEAGATSAKDMAPGHDEHAGKPQHQAKAEHGKKKAEHKATGKSKAPAHTTHHAKKAEPKAKAAAPATEPGTAAVPK